MFVHRDYVPRCDKLTPRGAISSSRAAECSSVEDNCLALAHSDRYEACEILVSIFILVINQIDAQNLFYSKFISCLYMFRAPCAHRQEVKIVLYSLWYTGRPPIGVMTPEAV